MPRKYKYEVCTVVVKVECATNDIVDLIDIRRVKVFNTFDKADFHAMVVRNHCKWNRCFNKG